MHGHRFHHLVIPLSIFNFALAKSADASIICWQDSSRERPPGPYISLNSLKERDWTASCFSRPPNEKTAGSVHDLLCLHRCTTAASRRWGCSIPTRVILISSLDTLWPGGAFCCNVSWREQAEGLSASAQRAPISPHPPESPHFFKPGWPVKSRKHHRLVQICRPRKSLPIAQSDAPYKAPSANFLIACASTDQRKFRQVVWCFSWSWQVSPQDQAQAFSLCNDCAEPGQLQKDRWRPRSEGKMVELFGKGGMYQNSKVRWNWHRDMQSAREMDRRWHGPS